MANGSKRSRIAGQRGMLQGKLHTARFFTRYELPRVALQAALLQRLDDTTLTMPADGF